MSNRSRAVSVEALRRLDAEEPENERAKQAVRGVVDRLRALRARVEAVTIEAEIARRRADADEHDTRRK